MKSFHGMHGRGQGATIPTLQGQLCRQSREPQQYHVLRRRSNNFVFHDYFKKMGKSDKAVWNYDPPKIVRSAAKELCSRLHQFLPVWCVVRIRQ